jgi:ubiquitin-conjugating enzyme E2 J1
MASPKTYNSRSSSVKRLLAEARELANLAEDGIYAAPLEENLHEFHFCIRGPQDSEFEGGLYHGRIIVSSRWMPYHGRADVAAMREHGSSSFGTYG